MIQGGEQQRIDWRRCAIREQIKPPITLFAQEKFVIFFRK